MIAETNDKTDMVKAVFDAMPSMLFVVDEDVCIQEYNASAASFMPGARTAIIDRRGGDALYCACTQNRPLKDAAEHHPVVTARSEIP